MSFGPLKKSDAMSIMIASMLMVSCENSQDATPAVDQNAVFLDFSADGQTVLPASIDKDQRQVRLEVDHDVDVSTLTPDFTVPQGYTVLLNGTVQDPGNSSVDFSQPVTYELKSKSSQSTTSWQVSAVPLACRIVVDASHDGGVWWFPQSEATGFDPGKPHQGEVFANILREKGFEVTELGRGVELTESMFFGSYIVIRVGGFNAYTSQELDVYTRLLDRGMNLLFFTDHKKFDPVDELGDHIGLSFKGLARGTVSSFTPHEVTQNIESIPYIAGSVLIGADQNPDLQVLGWLGPDDFADLNFNDTKDAGEPLGSPAMGILTYPNSRIFFIGDTNGIEVQPQPFIDNLLYWMGDCSGW